MKLHFKILLTLNLVISSQSLICSEQRSFLTRLKNWWHSSEQPNKSTNCQNCQNQPHTNFINPTQLLPNQNNTGATAANNPNITISSLPTNPSNSMSDAARIAIEQEKTKQIELANGLALIVEHERNRWFNALAQYHDQRAVQTSQDNNKELFRQAQNMLSAHHQALYDIESNRAKAELKKEEVRLRGLPQTLAHDLKKTELLHEQWLEKLKALGKGVMVFTNDKERMTKATLLLTGTALGIYTAKRGTKVAADYTASILMKPKLVSETSRLTLTEILLHPIKSLKNQKEKLPDIAYNQELHEQVSTYLDSVKQSTKEGQPFRHALFYGQPGTGKTLLAKKIAHELGMNYAIIPGANIHQFAHEDGIRAINELFDWAEQSKTVLFFDECDALAPSRLNSSVSEQTRKIQNTLYARTGTETKKFLVLGATNEPNLLDSAFLSRMDERIEFTLPDQKTRANLIAIYFNKYVPANRVTKDIAAHYNSIAKVTDGFSGRELSQLVRAFHAHAAANSVDKIITPNIIEKVIATAKAQRDNLASYDARVRNHQTHTTKHTAHITIEEVTQEVYAKTASADTPRKKAAAISNNIMLMQPKQKQTNTISTNQEILE